MRILDVGSMKLNLHEIAMDVFDTCLRNGISLETEWVPRELNEAADAASTIAEMVDTDDWQLKEEFFKLLNARWGPITLDAFAKVERF